MTETKPSDGLARVAIRNFQSLKKVNLQLGRFTAIVGQSNVGKSALLRALRLAARNGSSSGLVRAGEKSLSVAIAFEDGTIEAVKRGARESEFQLIPKGIAGDSMRWTKAGRDVPREVAAAWREPVCAAGDLMFSTQHDAPFLLAVPGSVVAATLGQLTNVAQVQEAVRLANRLRAEQTAEAKVRMREAEECAQQLRLMTDIPQRKKQLDGAEALLKDAEQAEADYVKLGTLIQQLAGAEATLGAAETAVRDLTGLDGCVAEAQAAVATWTVLETVLEDLTQHQHQADLWAQGQADLLAKADGLEHDRLVKLQAAGVCPTCGASTS